jgi:hypothetical protein
MESSPHSPVSPPRRRTIIVVIAMAGLYLLPLAGHPPATNPNELVRVELALAMATWATIDLDNPSRVYGLSEDVARHDDRLLADKAPGLSFLGVPVLWLSGWLLPTIPHHDLPQYWPARHLLTAVLVAFGTGLLCFFVAAKIPDLRESGWIPLALITCVSTPLWAYGTVFFGHAPAAVLITIAWILLLHPGHEASSTRMMFLGGASAGFAIATEYPVVVLVAIAFATLIARRVPGRQLAIALAGLAIGLVPALVYHQMAFGAPWLTGYAFKVDPGFQQIHTTGLGGVSLPTIRGLWGVLFSSSRGLFFYAPILLVFPMGLRLMHQRRGWSDIAPLGAAVVFYIAFASGFVDWQAGWCSATRHLVPLIPLLLIPTMTAMTAMAQHTGGLLLLTVLVAVSTTRSFLTLVVTPFFPPEFSNPLAEIVLPSLRQGASAPNVVSAVTGLAAGVVWAMAAGLVLALAIWSLATLSRRSTSTTVIAIVMAATIVGQMGWWVWRSPPPDPRLESYRAQLLAGLGHTEVATRIETGLRPGASSEGALRPDSTASSIPAHHR